MNYDDDIAKNVWATCDDCSGNPSKYSAQLCSLLCWWLSSPPERHNVDALIADCTIDAYLARRDAAQVAVADDARVNTLIDFLGDAEDTENHVIVPAGGRGGHQRRDIYARAGVVFNSGGNPAKKTEWKIPGFGPRRRVAAAGLPAVPRHALGRRRRPPSYRALFN